MSYIFFLLEIIMGDLSRWFSDLALRSMKTLKITVIQKVVHIIESSICASPNTRGLWELGCMSRMSIQRSSESHGGFWYENFCFSGKEIPAFLVFLWRISVICFSSEEISEFSEFLVNYVWFAEIVCGNNKLHFLEILKS